MADAAPAPAKKAARKTAKKATKKVTAEAPAETNLQAPAPAPASAAPAPVEAAPAHTAPAVDEPKRFGRVPGGGPTTPRADVPQDAAASSPSPVPPQDQPRPQGQGGHQQDGAEQQGQGGQGESRSKRRRDKRKKRREQIRNERGQDGGGGGGGHPQQQPQRQRGNDRHQRGNDRHNNPRGDRQQNDDREYENRGPVQLSGEKIEVDGMLELAPKGFGFLRVPKKNFEQARDDVFVTPEIIRKNHLRLGQWIHGTYQQGPRGPQLVEITAVNGMPVAEASKLPHFDELKAINPSKRISFETTPERFTTRVVDIMAPVGRGQRGLIVSPPRSGKTTLLLHMAEAIRTKYEETMHLMVLLVDERPEEVTEFRRALPGAEIYASSNDENARSHCRIAELAIERAKRLVEAGKDVFLLMDSITRLARAYNGNMNNRGRGTGSGGITIGALEVPRRLFAAARNTRGGGSLTILATALIQTNSRADEAIFMEFKGTGNMELVLDRKIAENYIYPAVDIFKSGTRREELLLPEHMLHKIHLIRRGLSGHRPVEAMERLLYFLKKFPNNPQMLLEIKG
ncbi:MAG: transcription termination factor Rho [Akkermansiaceae bacterium]|nr:transcription termination factor Rho [Akkermansiaceae bacterium]